MHFHCLPRQIISKVKTGAMKKSKSDFTITLRICRRRRPSANCLVSVIERLFQYTDYFDVFAQ